MTETQTEAPPPAPTIQKPAKPTVGRVIYVRSNLWTGVLAAIVVGVLQIDNDRHIVRANLQVDAIADPDLLRKIRARPEGNTVTLENGVQNPDAPQAVPGDRDWFTGEWMPFQVGQVPASLAVQGELTALREETTKIRDELQRACVGGACQRMAITEAVRLIASCGNPNCGDLEQRVNALLDGPARAAAETNAAATEASTPT